MSFITKSKCLIVTLCQFSLYSNNLKAHFFTYFEAKGYRLKDMNLTYKFDTDLLNFEGLYIVKGLDYHKKIFQYRKI